MAGGEAEGERAIDVRFASGDELLSAYWGYLTGGGLIIPDPGAEVGDALSMRVTIDVSESQYRLRGTVVKREPDSGRVIIASRSGEADDMLLSEALADSENVAPRRHPRFAVDTKIQAIVGDQERAARLINISREGCCIELLGGDGEGMPIDAEVAIARG